MVANAGKIVHLIDFHWITQLLRGGKIARGGCVEQLRMLSNLIKHSCQTNTYFLNGIRMVCECLTNMRMLEQMCEFGVILANHCSSECYVVLRIECHSSRPIFPQLLRKLTSICRYKSIILAIYAMLCRYYDIWSMIYRGYKHQWVSQKSMVHTVLRT